MRFSRLAAASLALVAACASARPERPATPLFVFRNGFWVNLHHFLRAEARRAARGTAQQVPPAELPPREREAWQSALDAYADVAKRDLLFDHELARINAALGDCKGETLEPSADIPPALAAALERAAPIYRQRGWPEHSRQNEQWIRELEPLVTRHAAMMTARLAAAYHVDWPTQPILVDPSFETGPYLAYTTEEAPPGFAGHITISSGEKDRGSIAFECLFHEASHVVDASLQRAIETESASQSVAMPPELWHAVIYYTSGFLTERALGRAGTYRADIGGETPAYVEPLEKNWRPRLEGTLPFDQALHDLVRDAAAELAATPKAAKPG